MKNLVVLCDGTSNAIEADVSNVARLLRCLVKEERQRVFYRPGVGSSARQAVWSERFRQAKAIFQLATGYGIDDDICAIYRFLSENYQEGDRICLFGFSRGAYTVRIVAALIHMAGLFAADQANLAEQLVRAYKQVGYRGEDDADEPADFSDVWRFRNFGEGRRVPLHFLGLFDTVSSVIVPGRNFFGLLPGTSRMPHTRSNPSVRVVRHALAIDEKRTMFRSNRWIEGQAFKPDPFAKETAAVPQDCQQVLFAGVHADIGGGYPEEQSGLAKIALHWMIEEARKHDVLFLDERVERFVEGEKLYPKDAFAPPAAAAKLHQSLTCGWWPLEYVPKRVSLMETRKSSFLGFYLPRGEARSFVKDQPYPRPHASVQERMTAVADYWPDNLPPIVTPPPAGPS